MLLHILLLDLLSLILGVETPGQPPQVQIFFAGDAMQHQAQLDRAKELGTNGEYDYSECFSLIAPDILETDYAVCNLEVPLGGGPDYSGYPCFSAPDSYAESLRDAGFNLLYTANNHCLDRRDKGARNTLSALDALGIDHIGTYDTPLQRDSLVPFIKDINGFKIGFLNYTYGTNGIEPREGVEVALIDKDKISQEIKKTREAGAEIIIVGMHWGIEYVLLENSVQRDLSDFLVNNGVDLVIGGHPHVIQPMKIVKNPQTGKNSLVIYSLGNFISNMKTADTRGGAIARAVLKRTPDGTPFFDSADYDLIFAAKPEKNHNFRVFPAKMFSDIPDGQKQHYKLFERGALKIFSEHNVGVCRQQQ